MTQAKPDEGLCPNCGGDDKVIDTRLVDGPAGRHRHRRRECNWCGTRFSTHETVLVDASTTVSAVIEATCAAYEIGPADLFDRTLTPRRIQARQVAMHLLHVHLNMSSVELGRRFDRDHSTVLHACKRLQEQLGNQPELAAKLKNIERAAKLGQYRTEAA